MVPSLYAGKCFVLSPVPELISLVCVVAIGTMRTSTNDCDGGHGRWYNIVGGDIWCTFDLICAVLTTAVAAESAFATVKRHRNDLELSNCLRNGHDFAH